MEKKEEKPELMSLVQEWKKLEEFFKSLSDKELQKRLFIEFKIDKDNR